MCITTLLKIINYFNCFKCIISILYNESQLCEFKYSYKLYEFIIILYKYTRLNILMPKSIYLINITNVKIRKNNEHYIFIK